MKRLGPLAEQGFVPTQQFDQAEVDNMTRQPRSAKPRNRKRLHTAQSAPEAAAEALVHAREAALAIATRAIEDTTVRAPHDGRIVGFSITSGEVVIPAQALFTLIDTETSYAVANFRETELKAIAIGDCVTAYSMIERRSAAERHRRGDRLGSIRRGAHQSAALRPVCRALAQLGSGRTTLPGPGPARRIR